MKTILITGGCGFIGSNFIKEFINDKNYFFVNLDNLTYASNKRYLKDIEKNNNYVFYKGDICDKKILNKIFKKHDIDYVINFAAETHVDRSYIFSSLFVNTNVLGTVNLLETCKKFWKNYENHRFIQISTDEVYGSTEKECTEKSKLNPSSPYSSSKASAELIALSYYKSFNLPILITRSSNNFGANQQTKTLIPKAFLTLSCNKDFYLYGTGQNLRDWLFVKDNVNAIKLVLEKGKTGEIYNICAKNEISNIEIVKMIIDYIKLNINKNIDYNVIKYTDDRLAHDFRYNISNEKIKNELGFKVSKNFKENLYKTLDYYKENLDYYKKLI